MAPWGERRFLVDCWPTGGLTANSIGWSSRGLAKLAGDRADKGSEGAGATALTLRDRWLSLAEAAST